MALVKGHIRDLSGGISTVPDLLRTPSEVKQETENVLFSPQRGCFRRPGTRIMARLSQHLEQGDYVWEQGAWVYKDGNRPNAAQRAIWVFPLSVHTAQVVMVRDRVWEMFWLDFRTQDFLREDDGSRVFVTPEGRTLSSPVLWGPRDENNPDRSIAPGSTPSDYMEIVNPENGYAAYTYEEIGKGMKPSPQKAFRIAKRKSKVYLLNRTKKVSLTNKVAPANIRHRHHYLVYFVAVTAASAVKCKVEWLEGNEKKMQEVDFGELRGVEKMGEDFQEKWSTVTGMFVSGLGNVMALRNLNPELLLEIKFSFTNVAAVVVTEEDDDLKALPTLDALPPYGCENWRLKVRGNVSSKLDDLWVVYSRDSKRREDP